MQTGTADSSIGDYDQNFQIQNMRVVIFQFSFSVIADSHIFYLMLLAEVSTSCLLSM
mgnify:CR=1 FL=1